MTAFGFDPDSFRLDTHGAPLLLLVRDDATSASPRATTRPTSSRSSAACTRSATASTSAASARRSSARRSPPAARPACTRARAGCGRTSSAARCRSAAGSSRSSRPRSRTRSAGSRPSGLYRAVNRVQPSFIRVDADEVTYGLHIILRFELERELLAGTLSTADLPEAWNARFEEYLGLAVPDDRLGVLQDVHWSCGAVRLLPDLPARQRDERADLGGGAGGAARPRGAVRAGRLLGARHLAPREPVRARPQADAEGDARSASRADRSTRSRTSPTCGPSTPAEPASSSRAPCQTKPDSQTAITSRLRSRRPRVGRLSSRGRRRHDELERPRLALPLLPHEKLGERRGERERRRPRGRARERPGAGPSRRRATGVGPRQAAAVPKRFPRPEPSPGPPPSRGRAVAPP